MQREVVDAQQGVNFVIVSHNHIPPLASNNSLHVHKQQPIKLQLVDNAIGTSPYKQSACLLQLLPISSPKAARCGQF